MNDTKKKQDIKKKIQERLDRAEGEKVKRKPARSMRREWTTDEQQTFSEFMKASGGWNDKASRELLASTLRSLGSSEES